MIEMSRHSSSASFPAVRLDHACFGCGDDNPIGLHLQFSPIDGGVTAPFTPEPTHQGFDNVIHGGIISAVLDEAMAWATTRAGIWAVTAEINVRFKNPLAVGEPTTVTARVAKNRGKIVTTAAELTSDRDGSPIATATATFIRVRESLANEWQGKYLAGAGLGDFAGAKPATASDDEATPGEQSQ